MYNTKKITDDVKWVGANERKLSLFENIFPIPQGVSYNSYIIIDEKTALLDTVDLSVLNQFLENTEQELVGRKLDYLIINHMEPDHCAAIKNVIDKYPNVKIVGNAKTFVMLTQFFNEDYKDRAVVVKEFDELSLGKHVLKFIMAPMVHWPEVMVTYDKTDKILFSADAFGSFKALDGNIFADEMNFEKNYIDEARRYYTNIVGKYGAPVQALLKKASALDIKYICPLHGPVFRENLEYIIGKYNTWSTYMPEEKGVVIIYASMYGSTKSAAEALASRLSDKGIKNLAVYDVSNTDISVLIGEIFKMSHIVFASPTYNTEIYPLINNLLCDMKMLGVQNRTVAVIENGSWAPAAGRKIIEKLSELKNINLIDTKVSIKSSLHKEKSGELSALAESIAATV